MSLSSRSLQSIFSNKKDRKLFVDCLRRSQTEGPPEVIDVPNVERDPVVDGPSIISQDTWPLEYASGSSYTTPQGLSSARTSASTTSADATSTQQNTEASSGIDRNSTEFLSTPPSTRPLHFPAKLHSVLSQPNFHHILSWSDDGKSLIIKDVDLFEREILHNYFEEMKHFRSFQKQLQRYNFKAICSTLTTGTSKKSICYARDNFERGRHKLCDEIYKEYVEQSKRKREEKKRNAKTSRLSESPKKIKCT